MACGVRIFDTATLNSDIISGVTAFGSTPFALAIDFCKLPRWSIAAAAMIPSLFENAFMCFNFPAERTDIYFNGFAASLAGNRPWRGPHRAGSAPSGLRALELPFVAHAPHKLRRIRSGVAPSRGSRRNVSIDSVSS